MKRVCLLIGLLFCMAPVWGGGNLELKSPLTTQQLGSSKEVGSLGVSGIGKVTFFAKREGSQVIVKASGPGGKVIGRAETTIGLNRTPIYISAPGGLQKIEILWNSPD